MNRSILVIEKNEDILELVTIILTNKEFTVIALKSEENALQTILEVKPCAIILDIIQVTQEGTQLCKLIKATQEAMHIPIIVLSTHPKAETIKNVCADEVLMKPFDIHELVAAVEKHLVNYP